MLFLEAIASLVVTFSLTHSQFIKVTSYPSHPSHSHFIKKTLYHWHKVGIQCGATPEYTKTIHITPHNKDNETKYKPIVKADHCSIKAFS